MRQLSHEGYSLVLRAAQRAGRKDATELDTSDPLYQDLRDLRRSFLFEEQAATEWAIEKLGKELGNFRPSCIPGINKIYNLKHLNRERAVRIEVMGMFGTGKSTFLKKLEQIGNLIIAELLARPERENKVVFFDRLFEDQPVFTRARLLVGDLDPTGDDYNNRHWLMAKTALNGTILLMIPPYLSLARHVEEGIGRYRNLNFLDVLYQQYLRFIYEARDRGLENFAVLNMSGGNYGEKTKEKDQNLLNFGP